MAQLGPAAQRPPRVGYPTGAEPIPDPNPTGTRLAAAANPTGQLGTQLEPACQPNWAPATLANHPTGQLATQPGVGPVSIPDIGRSKAWLGTRPARRSLVLSP